MDFSHLKPGDQVGVEEGRSAFIYRGRLSIETIESQTPKFLVVNGLKYRKSDGFGHGSTNKLVPLEEARDRIKHEQQAKKKRDFEDYAGLLNCNFSIEFMEELEAVIKKHNKFRKNERGN